jgi:hypothetical protein
MPHFRSISTERAFVFCYTSVYFGLYSPCAYFSRLFCVAQCRGLCAANYGAPARKGKKTHNEERLVTFRAVEAADEGLFFTPENTHIFRAKNPRDNGLWQI